MDWLRNIISSLPMDSISEFASRVTIWWSHLVADVPPDMLPIYAYIGFSIIVLLLWLILVKILPSPLGGMSWLAVFAVLLAPSTAAGNSSEIAPACIGVIYGILMKEPGTALRSLLPILVIFALGLFLGFIWQLIRNLIESHAKRTSQQAAKDEKANLQLASANYIDIIEGQDEAENQDDTSKSILSRTKKPVPKAAPKKQSEVKTAMSEKQDSAKQDIDNTDS